MVKLHVMVITVNLKIIQSRTELIVFVENLWEVFKFTERHFPVSLFETNMERWNSLSQRFLTYSLYFFIYYQSAMFRSEYDVGILMQCNALS